MFQKLISEIRFLFQLLLGADANMKMVRRKVSSEVADPSLSHGWAYFVETTRYKEHLDSIGPQKETVSDLKISSVRELTIDRSEIYMRQPSCCD